MKLRKSLISIALFATSFIWFAGCSILDPKPRPNVSFTYSEVPGGVIDFRVNATNASSYYWDFGDGMASSEKEPYHSYTANGTFVVTLKATGDGGSSTFTEQITINDVTGSVIFWVSGDPGHGYINIKFDNGLKGTIVKYYPQSMPDCNATGCVTAVSSPGIHQYEAYTDDGSYHKTGQLTITARACLHFAIY